MYGQIKEFGTLREVAMLNVLVYHKRKNLKSTMQSDLVQFLRM